MPWRSAKVHTADSAAAVPIIGLRPLCVAAVTVPPAAAAAAAAAAPVAPLAGQAETAT